MSELIFGPSEVVASAAQAEVVDSGHAGAAVIGRAGSVALVFAFVGRWLAVVVVAFAVRPFGVAVAVAAAVG